MIFFPTTLPKGAEPTGKEPFLFIDDSKFAAPEKFGI
jgi:hypothetical protein